MGIRTTMVRQWSSRSTPVLRRAWVLDKSGKQRHQGFLAWMGVGECGKREEPKRTLVI